MSTGSPWLHDYTFTIVTRVPGHYGYTSTEIAMVTWVQCDVGHLAWLWSVDHDTGSYIVAARYGVISDYTLPSA